MKRANKIFLLLLFTVFFAAQAGAQSTSAISAVPGDERVAKALNQTKTDYQVNSKDGLYMVTYETKNKRSQKVLIAAKAEMINGVEMRLIFSFALFSDKPLSQRAANLLLEKNAGSVSTWAVHKLTDGKYAVVCQLYIPADFDGEKLQTALQEVVTQADEMEEKLSKKDEN